MTTQFTATRFTETAPGVYTATIVDGRTKQPRNVAILSSCDAWQVFIDGAPVKRDLPSFRAAVEAAETAAMGDRRSSAMVRAATLLVVFSVLGGGAVGASKFFSPASPLSATQDNPVPIAAFRPVRAEPGSKASADAASAPALDAITSKTPHQPEEPAARPPSIVAPVAQSPYSPSNNLLVRRSQRTATTTEAKQPAAPPPAASVAVPARVEQPTASTELPPDNRIMPPRISQPTPIPAILAHEPEADEPIPQPTSQPTAPPLPQKAIPRIQTAALPDIATIRPPKPTPAATPGTKRGTTPGVSPVPITAEPARPAPSRHDTRRPGGRNLTTASRFATPKAIRQHTPRQKVADKRKGHVGRTKARRPVTETVIIEERPRRRTRSHLADAPRRALRLRPTRAATYEAPRRHAGRELRMVCIAHSCRFR